ncbi:hypothetical protein [Amycolatopsis sp. CA-230715]|uniref:hypothetical protein n=1 Tax=Amycolatopsis sp. CA-230715 TaxID=2745196 RepID=UPI001C3314F1|nr:hypothetical protein HUW46_01653 [Amycolatopsis sp. CA-230715]
MTPREQREGEPIEDRLAEERADVEPDEVPARPIAATPADRLDQSIEDAPADDEPVAPGERPARRTAEADHGENADVAGGSVADSIRTAR